MSFRRDIKKAFVVDDSVKQRFGKKMPGISSHFDHTTGRHMMGQQVLTLGLSCESRVNRGGSQLDFALQFCCHAYFITVHDTCVLAPLLLS